MQNFVFSLFLSVAVAFAAIATEEGVLVLTDSNFDEAIAQNDILLVEFYAPWCGHCKTLAPEYAKAATDLADSPAMLAKVDATEQKEVASKHGIKGFPTLKFFKNGKASDYNGGRTAPEIVSWLNKKSGPAAKTITTADELAALQEAQDVFVVGVFDDVTSDDAKAFLTVAGGDDSLTYAITSDAAVKGSLGVTAPTVVVLKSFDDKRNDMALTGAFDTAAVETFIAGASVPLIQTFSQEAAKKIFSSPVKNHMLFFTDASADHHAPTVATFTELAKTYKGKALFINVPHSETRVLDYFGITVDQLPQLVLAEMAEDNMKKFPFVEELSSDNIKTFLESFFAGTLKAHLKSEAVDPADTAGDVTVLKGTSFNELVMDNTKDVLVKFYAPWCGHCKKLAPVWDEIGARMKDNKDTVIAKMDSTANEIDVPGVTVKGFPTIYFFKGDDKAHPKVYESGREADDFIAYLKENSHNAVTSDHDEL